MGGRGGEGRGGSGGVARQGEARGWDGIVCDNAAKKDVWIEGDCWIQGGKITACHLFPIILPT